MENERIPKEHLIDSIEDISKALKEILDDVKQGQDSDYWLMTLLCRVGELECCLDYNLELKYAKGKKVQIKPNRLCTCYDYLRSDEYV